MNQTYVFLLLPILGFLSHSLIKLDGLQKDAAAANLPFNWVKDYLVKDRFSLMLSLVASATWYFVFEETANKYPAIRAFKGVSFFCMGALGSYVIQLILGKAKRTIRGVVDYKTNKADGIQ